MLAGWERMRWPACCGHLEQAMKVVGDCGQQALTTCRLDSAHTRTHTHTDTHTCVLTRSKFGTL
eukprot:1144426-Pelagomonas_calceolata.AAC.9